MITDSDRENAQIFLPADADYSEFKSDDEIEWEKFRDEMADGIEYSKLSIWRVPLNERGQPTRKQMGFCFECGMQDYSFSQLCSRIQSEFGGGIYRLQARDERGKMIKNKGIAIEAPLSGPNSADSPSGIIDSVRTAITDGQEQTRRMLTSAHNPQAIIDPVDQMTKMMTAIGTMMGAIGLKPQEQLPQKSITDQIQEFVLLKELIDGGRDSGSGEANIFSLLTETIRNFGPLLGAALAAGQKDGTVSPGGIIQKIPQRLANPIKETAEVKNPELEAMRPQLEFLLKQAKGGATPGDVATFVMSAIPDDKLEDIENFLKREDCINLCIELIPEVEQYGEWFVSWQTAMLVALDKALEDAPEDSGTNDLTSEQEPAQNSDVAVVAGENDTVPPAQATADIAPESAAGHDSNT